MTEGDSFIGAFSAFVGSDGKLELLMNSTEVTGKMTDDQPYGSAMLTILSENQHCDLALSAPAFDASTFCVDRPMSLAFEL